MFGLYFYNAVFQDMLMFNVWFVIFIMYSLTLFYYQKLQYVVLLVSHHNSAMSAVLVELPIVLRRICTTVDTHLF